MPKEKSQSSEWSSIPAHRHCVVCGKSVNPDKDICSQQCEGNLASRRKSQRRSTWIFVGVIGAMALVWLLLMPLLGGRPPK